MRHSRSAVFVHFVWGTRERVPLLVGERERIARRTIGAKCQEKGADIIALGNVEDHVHLLLTLPPMLCVADSIKLIKGFSAFVINQEVRDGTLFRWQGAYGAFSVSRNDLDLVSAYVHQQRAHHQLGSLRAEWEIPQNAEDARG